jgi:hypothetical protein
MDLPLYDGLLNYTIRFTTRRESEGQQLMIGALIAPMLNWQNSPIRRRSRVPTAHSDGNEGSLARGEKGLDP